MTAYASKAGMESYVFMPKDAPEANQKEVSISGAKLELIDGLISDAGKLSAQLAEELDLFDVSTLKEPYRVEGKKTMGYEIASTIAAGIRVPVAVADYLILEAVRESGGKALTVTDESMLTWIKTVASLEGMFFCPEGAATLSALQALFDDGSLLRSERILILNTGSGLKYLELVTLASNSKMSN